MKRFTQLLFLTVLFFTSFAYSQKNHVPHLENRIRNEVYQKIKISNPTPTLINKLAEIGLDLDCGSQLDSDGNLLIEVSIHETEMIKKITNYQVVIADMEKFYVDRAVKNLPIAKSNLKIEKSRKDTNSNKSSSLKATTFGNITHRFENTEIDWVTPSNFQLGAAFGGCLTVDEANAQLDLMHTLYPNLISIKANASPSNQLTIEGRTVYVVKISNSNISGTKPQTLYTGMTHSREVASLMNLNFYMWYLLENYATDPDVKNLVDNHELYFIPIVNPDGLAFNQTQAPNGGGMQRKNRRDTGSCSTYTDGIDLNRNWGTYWGYDNTGSSNLGCDDTYRGTAGFSEAETTIIKDFFLLHNFKTSVNHHAYKNAALHGRAAFYRANNVETNTPVLTGREDEYYQYSHDMTQFSRYAYGSSPNISYWNNGNCNDWMTEGSGKNTLCWTPENGAANESTSAYLNSGFWPDPVNITAISKRAMRMNFIAGFYSGMYAKLHDLTKSDITSTTGTLSFGLERLGQTDGNFTLTVTPISSNILSVTNVPVQSGITVLEQRNLGVNFTLNPSITNKEKIVFEATLTNGTYTIYKTRIEKYYNPTNLFTPTANPTTMTGSGWTAAGTWTFTATDGFGGTAGYTSNAAATYANANGSTSNLTQTTAISLAGKQQVVVQFNTKWDLERSFDYVQLQGSADGGTTWTPLNGKYTKPGASLAVNDYSTTLNSTSKTSGDKGFQPDNQPLYDGNKFDKWVLEEYYITSSENVALFNSANVKFRFIFRTDSNNRTHGYNTTFKGFRFDNFEVLEIKSSPPVAICKNATLLLGASGFVTVLASDVNNGSTDDVAITNMTVTPNTFNCSFRNTIQSVTLTVTDADGQTSSCIANVTIVDPNPVAGTISTNQSICSGTQPTSITITGSTGTIQWQSSVDNSTFNTISGQTNSTLSGATIGTLTSTRYFRALISNGNCGISVLSSVVTIIVNDLPSAPTATNSTQYGNQIPTASVADTNGFTTPTFTWYADNSTTTALQTSTSVTYLTSVSSTTTFYVSVTNPTTGCKSSRTPVTIIVSNLIWNGSVSNVWTNANNWTPNIVPNGSQNVIIQSLPTPSLNINFTLGVGNTLNVFTDGGLIVEPNIVLKIAGTANFNSKSILFKSDNTGTGIFGELTGTVSGADNVTVQRYIKGRRAFRFLTPGVTTTTSIYQNWQNGGINTLGIGTHITGGSTGGFDVTGTNNPSLHSYNAQATGTTTGFTAIPNTNATILKVGVGYRLLVRGDRNVVLTNPSEDNMNVPTTLTATGTIKTGTVTFDTSGSSPSPINNNATNTQTNGYTLIGNPYVSPVDWHSVAKTNVNNNAYYTWDPTLGTTAQRGRYVVYTQTGPSTGTSNIYLPSTGTDALTTANRRYLQSGQAVFVKNSAPTSTATLIFNESNKTTSSSYVFKSSESLVSGNSSLYLSVYEPNELALGGSPIDGASAIFGNEYSTNLDANDVDKLQSSGENLAFVRENKNLAIETLAPVVPNDELLIKTIQFQANKTYTFKLNTENFDTTVSAKVVDMYLNNETSIDLTQSSFVDFTTNSDALSYASERFKIVFNNATLGNNSFNQSAVILYPNPIVDNQFTLGLPASITGKVSISISNMLGQEVYKLSRDASPTMIIKPNRNLEEGIYIVSITNNEEVLQIKVVVKKYN